MSILDVIQQDMLLTKKGKDWWAPCPFHSEDTASFSVSPDKEFFHCFGCGVHGDAIDWLRQRRGYSYPDAAKAVGKTLVPLPPHPASPIFAVARAYLALAEEESYFQTEWAMLCARLYQAAQLSDLHSDAYKLTLVHQLMTLLDWETALQTLWATIRTQRDGLL